MQRCHNIRLGLISTVLLAEPFLADPHMIVMIAAAAIASLFCTRRQIELHEKQATERTARRIIRSFTARYRPQTDE
jgi:hypothetical protein